MVVRDKDTRKKKMGTGYQKNDTSITGRKIKWVGGGEFQKDWFSQGNTRRQAATQKKRIVTSKK